MHICCSRDRYNLKHHRGLDRVPPVPAYLALQGVQQMEQMMNRRLTLSAEPHYQNRSPTDSLS